MKTLRLWATLAALILAASTAGAAVVDMGDALGPSGGYSSQAYYQAMLGGQPMTAAQQTYADQEDQLRQLGFQSELGGNFAVGQMFYHMAYGLTPGVPSEGLGWLRGLGSSGLGSSGVGSSGVGSSAAQGGLGAGSSDLSSASDFYSSVGVGVVDALILPDPGTVPEPSTWAMLLLGFVGLGYAGWRGSRKRALHST